jgi:DNA-binding transcriptional LysR family regulator
MAVFASVVDEGSFRSAAKKLGVAPSRVSHTISDLEDFLEVTLLNRTTRKLYLTDEGRKFYKHVVGIVKSAEAGVDELNANAQHQIGSLKISLPAFMGTSAIATRIAKFAEQHPKVNLSLTYTDQVTDILKEGLDLSIRAGWLEDSSMLSRKLDESERLLVASKQYYSSMPKPIHPSNLKNWKWIRFDMRSPNIQFTHGSGETVTVQENSRISMNSAEALLHFTRENLGLTILPEHLVKGGIESGELIHVLPEWKQKPLGYYAVWPDTSRRENLTLLLVRFLAENSHD